MALIGRRKGGGVHPIIAVGARRLAPLNSNVRRYPYYLWLTTMTNRPKLSRDVEREILLRSRRRCCLCYGLSGNFDERIGQIAHIDHNSSNNALDNLAWLCFEHHSLYDSTTRQHKNYQPDELKAHRSRLYAAIATSAILGPDSLGEYIATESSSHVIRLLDRILVIFDWPMRCTPTLYIFPRGLVQISGVIIEQWTVRGFQIVFKNIQLLPSRFAFFADASPTEYKAEVQLEIEDWKRSVGYDDDENA